MCGYELTYLKSMTSFLSRNVPASSGKFITSTLPRYTVTLYMTIFPRCPSTTRMFTPYPSKPRCTIALSRIKCACTVIDTFTLVHAIPSVRVVRTLFLTSGNKKLVSLTLVIGPITESAYKKEIAHLSPM